MSLVPLTLLKARVIASDLSKLSDLARESICRLSREDSHASRPSPDSSIINSSSDIPPSTYSSQDLVTSAGTDVNIFSGEDEFKANLLEYSRSVIKSAMDHNPKETQALEGIMRLSKGNVVAQYKQAQNTITTLETDLSLARESIWVLEESIAKLKADQAGLNADLKLEIQITAEVKRMYQAQMARENRDFDSWKKERAQRKQLEVEIGTLKHEKKRKRENVAEIWEKVEKVKVNK